MTWNSDRANRQADEYLRSLGMLVEDLDQIKYDDKSLEDIRKELKDIEDQLKDIESGSAVNELEYEVAVEEMRLRNKSADYERQLWEFERAQRDREARRNFPTASLDLRLFLEQNRHSVDFIRQDESWLRLISIVYGGYQDHEYHRVLPEIRRVSTFLSLSGEAQKLYLPFFKRDWRTTDEKVLYQRMREYIQSRPLLRSDSTDVRKPYFQPENIYRDSDLTSIILEALQSEEPAANLIEHLRYIAEEAHSSERLRCDALLALAALDEDVIPILSQLQKTSPEFIDYFELQARQRLEGLKDSTVRAVYTTIPATLNDIHRHYSEFQWMDILSAVIQVTIDTVDVPVELNEILQNNDLTELQQGQLLSEIWAYFMGSDAHETQLQFALFLDQHTSQLASNAEVLATSIVNLNWVRNWKHYYHPFKDIISRERKQTNHALIDILDVIIRIPSHFAFFRTWLLKLLKPLIEQFDGHEPLIKLISLLNQGPATDSMEVIDIYELRFSDEYDRVHILTALPDEIQDVQDPLLRFVGYYLFLRITPLEQISNMLFDTLDNITDPREQVIVSQFIELPTDTLQSLIEVVNKEVLDAETRSHCLGHLARIVRGRHNTTIKYLTDSICAISDEWVRSETYLKYSDLIQISPDHNERVVSSIVSKQYLPKIMRQESQLLSHVKLIEPTVDMALDSWAVVNVVSILDDLVSQISDQNTEIAYWNQLLTDEYESAVAYFLKRSSEQLIPITVNETDVLVNLLDDEHFHRLEYILPILQMPDLGAQAILKTWLEQSPNPLIRACAALYLAEVNGLQANHIELLIPLLNSPHDLARQRAQELIQNTRFGVHIETASELGLELIMQLAKHRVDLGRRFPGNSLLFAWRFENILFDSVEIFQALLEIVNDTRNPNAKYAFAALRLFKHVSRSIGAVFAEALRTSTFYGQQALIHMLSRTFYGSYSDISQEQFQEIEKSLLLIAEENLAEDNFFLLYEAAYPDKIAQAIVEATEQNATVYQRVAYARESHLIRAPEFFQLILDDPDQIQTVLAQFGKDQFHTDAHKQRVMQGAKELTQKEEYVHVLFEWLISALNENIRDDATSWLRMNLLELSGAVVDIVPATYTHKFGSRAEAMRIQYVLVMAAQFNNTFPGRQAAIKMLSYLRYLSSHILEALKLTYTDVSIVRDEAILATSRFTTVSEDYIDDILEFLKDESAVVVYTTGEILSRISQNNRSNHLMRQRIAQALTEVIQSPYAHRGIYMGGYIPNAPILSQELYGLLLNISGLVDLSD